MKLYNNFQKLIFDLNEFTNENIYHLSLEHKLLLL